MARLKRKGGEGEGEVLLCACYSQHAHTAATIAIAMPWAAATGEARDTAKSSEGANEGASVEGAAEGAAVEGVRVVGVRVGARVVGLLVGAPVEGTAVVGELVGAGVVGNAVVGARETQEETLSLVYLTPRQGVHDAKAGSKHRAQNSEHEYTAPVSQLDRSCLNPAATDLNISRMLRTFEVDVKFTVDEKLLAP